MTTKKRQWKPRTEAQRKRDNAAAKRRRELKAKGKTAQVRTPKVKVRKKAERKPASNGREDGARTAYRVTGPFPEHPREGTTGREILETMKAAGQSTMPELMSAIKAPPATVRKWVHMLRKIKAVESVSAAHA